jgi:hypothetical protein
MSLVSAVPGKAFSTTLSLAQAACGPVRWSVRDNRGNLVLKGQVPPTGNTVIINGVLPSSVKVPPDGSRFSISATDGKTSAIEYFEVISPLNVEPQAGPIAYLYKHQFKDTLLLPRKAEFVNVKIALSDGCWPLGNGQEFQIPEDQIHRRGDAFLYVFNFGDTVPGMATVPRGTLETHPQSTFGTGSVIWDFFFEEGDEGQDIHPLYTITAHTMTFITGIQMMVDKARIGDVNNYLAYTSADLAHAFMRGLDFVMQSPPVSGGWPIDHTPIMLKDYVIKAGAVDILRSQYQAEGVSAFDLQGMRTQLQVDRTQYLAQLIGELEADLAGLVQAKNYWLAQGAPLGNVMSRGQRPIGILSLSRGTYSPWPMIPLPVIVGGYSWIGGGIGYGPILG